MTRTKTETKKTDKTFFFQHFGDGVSGLLSQMHKAITDAVWCENTQNHSSNPELWIF